MTPMQTQNLLLDNVTDQYRTRKFQNILLNMMLYIDRLCRQNGIEYCIIGGSALGAARHRGFIPWDDDLDIAMTRRNYDKFIALCESQLDTDDFNLQREETDWPLYFSKIRLKGTSITEIEEDSNIPPHLRGIFIDIFPLDNVPNSRPAKLWWYFCGKMLLAYSLHKRGYKSASLPKKLVMAVSFPLKNNAIRRYFKRQTMKYNSREPFYLAGFSLISRYHNAFVPHSIYGAPQYVDFETVTLPVPEKLNDYLTMIYGDYMTLPPEKDRAPKHITAVDFGKY